MVPGLEERLNGNAVKRNMMEIPPPAADKNEVPGLEEWNIGDVVKSSIEMEILPPVAGKKVVPGLVEKLDGIVVKSYSKMEKVTDPHQKVCPTGKIESVGTPMVKNGPTDSNYKSGVD